MDYEIAEGLAVGTTGWSHPLKSRYFGKEASGHGLAPQHVVVLKSSGRDPPTVIHTNDKAVTRYYAGAEILIQICQITAELI